MIDPCKELARLRKEKGLTLKALAELAGTKPKYIGDLEHGKLPGFKVASKLARVLEVPVQVLWIKYKRPRFVNMEAVECREKNIHQCTESAGLEILNLSPRSFNALYRSSIESVSEKLLLSEEELSKIRDWDQQVNVR